MSGKIMFRWFLSAGTIVMIIGGIQKINPDLLLNRGSRFRVFTTLVMLFIFLVWSVFVFCRFILALKENNKKGFWFWYACIGVFLAF
jgi:hypothetical protein